MTIADVTKESECCCSCKHNIRTRGKGQSTCNCDIDGHYIGYVACFESVCDRWEGDADGFSD